ncbi:pentatricopeptide repeat-containing protein At1g71490 [Macadamia integrifolia]|uniref:pentatricopeptide repeat-containing protein At1g71490 n=1 Tax=Macadamia integrifolia TaxID=60698 RepID=UPI001C4E5AB2|nr:pentatricopeptide repeat-containing protein At1g71490 [Macadamia integrifolia]XP_042502480.1 pentatricopeptide repeat-containing protein At1g71490 [Macadamia integrifolia]XP_042502481.1 pentatricopeptide repeat-containing protein At1g71490 [Macadamia integrifolia]XP_042502482.1 pentatricopeptide repeat-containing protein At1g71490 [Macadamia integrifolia]
MQSKGKHIQACYGTRGCRRKPKLMFKSSSVLSRTLSKSYFQKFIPTSWKRNLQNSLPHTPYECEEPVTDSKSLPKDPPTKAETLIDSLQSSLRTFTSQGQLHHGFKVFSIIQFHAASSNSFDLVVHPISLLLSLCITLKSLPQGKQLHSHIISLGLVQSPVLVPKLVTFYSTFNFLNDARSITDNSNIWHALPWNILISVYVKKGLYSDAISSYKQMVNMGVKPDNFTYPSVLKACGEAFDLVFGREIHWSVEASHLEWSLVVQNALISMYIKCGEVGIARSLFDKMPERDVITWNTMISGYASRGMWVEAFELFERMRDGDIEVNIVTWNTIAGGCLQMSNSKGALDLISQMRNHGVCLDIVSTLIGLGACSRIGCIKLGKEIHSSAIRSCCEEVESVKNALITMYSRCKDLRHAHVLFRLTKTKTIVTWNSMIAGYSSSDLSEEASFIFREMLISGFVPNYVTIASILPLCARVANLQHGKELHCYILRHGGFKDYLLVWNSLVDMYSKSGKISEAQKVFELMSKRDEVTYTSLIAGYGSQGEGQVALKLFEEMNMSRIKPDHITMVAILSACSHSGLVSEGQMIFEKMTTLYRINPRLEHFACMVDLFGRAGLLRKAVEIITRMPFRPTPPMWATLIGACHIHGNMEIGEWVAEKLLEMQPDNAGYYVLIANMYAAAGCWSKLAKVRTFMRDLGVRKTPGCAWIDVGSGFYPFLVGDRSNSHAQEIYSSLEGLTELMKDAGYVASNNLDLLANEDFE